MGKISIGTKERTTPFTWNGKQVVKFTIGGKVCTLQAANAGSTCGLMKETFANGFAYAGTWPTDSYHRNYLTMLKSKAVSDYVNLNTNISGVTGVIWPFASFDFQIPATATCVDFTYNSYDRVSIRFGTAYSLKSVIFSNATLVNQYIRGATRLENIIAPVATRFESSMQKLNINSIDFPKAETVRIDAYQCPKLTSISLPEGVDVEFQTDSHLTHINLPKARFNTSDFQHRSEFKGIVNAPTTTVTMRSSYNSTYQKDKLFGAGNWDQITFTWV